MASLPVSRGETMTPLSTAEYVTVEVSDVWPAGRTTWPRLSKPLGVAPPTSETSRAKVASWLNTAPDGVSVSNKVIGVMPAWARTPGTAPLRPACVVAKVTVTPVGVMAPLAPPLACAVDGASSSATTASSAQIKLNRRRPSI